MSKEEKKENVYNRKWLSILGFLISIFLLTLAIVLSMNEEKVSREAKLNIVNINSQDIDVLEQASSELTRSVNEMQQENTLNEVEMLNEIDSNTVSQNIVENNSAKEEKNDENKQNNSENNINSVQENKTNESKVVEQFIKPVDGEIKEVFSMDSLTYSNTLQEWITHRGIDIKADKTTVVKASADGTVKAIKEDPRYGLSITIEHKDGFQTVYSSLLSSEFVKEGDSVKQGQSIGTVGNSAVFESLDGSHLHFEILKDGEYVNPDIYIK